MPRAFEDVEQELVEDRLVAAGAGVSHPADGRFASACVWRSDCHTDQSKSNRISKSANTSYSKLNNNSLKFSLSQIVRCLSQLTAHRNVFTNACDFYGFSMHTHSHTHVHVLHSLH